MGLNKCKLHIKETVYWPGLNEQLEKISVKLLTVSQILKIQMQAAPQYVTGKGNTAKPMDKACDRYFLLRRSVIFVSGWLYKSISDGA